MASENSSITPGASGGSALGGFGSLNQAFSLAGGAVTDLFGAQAAKTSADGDRLEASSYRQAAGLANDDASFAQTSEQVQEFQQNRATFQAEGTTQSDVAGAGLAASGSALDILRDSAQQGSLASSMIRQQGSINIESYHEQADALNTQAQAADMAAKAQDEQAGVSKWSGIIKGVGAVLEGAAVAAPFI